MLFIFYDANVFGVILCDLVKIHLVWLDQNECALACLKCFCVICVSSDDLFFFCLIWSRFIRCDFIHIWLGWNGCGLM